MGTIIAIVIAIILFYTIGSWLNKLTSKANLYDHLKPRLDKVEAREIELKNRTKQLEDEKTAIETIAKEKSKGFPWLSEAYADYYHLQDLKTASYLQYKSHPAQKAADTVREIASEKRSSEKMVRMLTYQLHYYETLFPWLTEFKEDGIDDLIKQSINDVINDGDEIQDPAKHWLTEAEYNSLSSAERNQRALDRYWIKKKSKWEIGRDYERYIGSIYETAEWKVKYQGIVEGFADLGRDLIATQGNKTQIIQCKYWSREKTIHEKHIFQLYGTSIAYGIDNPNSNVEAVFITSTSLSDRAKLFAKHLGVSYTEFQPLEKYPCIKCNVSKKDGTKIYHLPFDQQYDTTTIEAIAENYTLKLFAKLRN